MAMRAMPAGLLRDASEADLPAIGRSTKGKSKIYVAG